MKDLNRILLLGRVGADPVRRETKKGICVVNFPVATSRKFYRELSEREESGAEKGASKDSSTQWHQIVVWGNSGENCFRYLRKGQPVFVEGSVYSHSYQSKQGVEKMSFEVHANQVSFLGHASSPSSSSSSSSESQSGEKLAS